MNIHQRSLLLTMLIILLAGAVLYTTTRANEAGSGTVTPEKGPPGTLFEFRASGFEPRERVNPWVIGPDGRTYNVGIGDVMLVADGNGAAKWEWAAPDFIPAGTFLMRARGDVSRMVIDIPFDIEGTEEQPAGPPGQQSSWMVEPEQGKPGTTFTFVARSTGFIPGEQVGSWFILPDGSTMNVDQGISVDPNGQIFRIWTAPEEYAPGGTWTFRARGIASGFQVDIPFFIDNVANLPSPTPVPLGVTPASGPHGTPFTFQAGGFSGGELVSTWVEGPDGVSRDAVTRVYADINGLATWTWAPPDYVPAGAWRMMVRGTSTHTERAINFEVTSSAAVPPAPNPTLVPTPLTLPTPRPESGGSVGPASGGAPGTEFTFSAYGFSSKEYIFFWAVDPDGNPLENTEELRADENGHVVWTWRAPPDAKSGEWSMAARGKVSSIRVQIPFTIGGVALPERTSVEPNTGGPGTKFRFTARGFVPKEYVDIWAIGPNGENLRGPTRERADWDGFIHWSWIAPDEIAAGVWYMHAKGIAVDSRVEYFIPFTIERDEPLPDAGSPFGVVPDSGPPGTQFFFYAEGYHQHEGVSYWLTAPDGTIISPDDEEDDPYKARVFADRDGRIEWMWTAPPDAQPGIWLMVTRTANPDGIDRDITYVIQFRIEETL